VILNSLPQYSASSIAGVVFLRLICPAICTPNAFGVISTDIQPKSQRVLVLVSKMIQTLANGSEFTEGYMTDFNPWVNQNKVYLESFVESLLQPLETKDKSKNAHKIPSSVKKLALESLKYTIYKHQSKLREYCSISKSISSLDKQMIEKILDKLEELRAQEGDFELVDIEELSIDEENSKSQSSSMSNIVKTLLPSMINRRFTAVAPSSSIELPSAYSYSASVKNSSPSPVFANEYH